MARKRIKHMGMALTKEEHGKWHEEHTEVSPDQHALLMSKMGISREEDDRWHRKHSRTHPASEKMRKPISPFAVGGGFLKYCVKRGWLTKEREGRRALYYVTRKGKKELLGFGIRT